MVLSADNFSLYSKLIETVFGKLSTVCTSGLTSDNKLVRHVESSRSKLSGKFPDIIWKLSRNFPGIVNTMFYIKWRTAKLFGF